MPESTPSKAPRPLPSVGFPLLREELRSSRQKKAGVVGILLAIAGTIVGAAMFWPSSTGEAPEETPVPLPGGASPVVPDAVVDEAPLAVAEGAPTAELPDLPAAPIEAPVQRVDPAPENALGTPTTTEHAFGRSASFKHALLAAGCAGAEADALISSLERLVDFRRCRPEDKLKLERDATGALSRFTYRSERTHYFAATRTARGDYRAERVQVPIDKTRRTIGGVVTGALGEALERTGVSRNLAGLFVETFESLIAFNSQTRAGDTFRVILDEERIEGSFLRWGTVHAIEYTGTRAGRHRAYWFAPRNGEGDFYDATGRAVHGGFLRTPLRYDHISSPYNPRRLHPILRRVVPHNGIDYSAGTGTPVWAAGDGTVTFAGEKGPNGNLVSIRHASGYESYYAHLSRIAPGMRPGTAVRQRQTIGYVGTTGRSTGPHLHFGMRRNGRFVNPATELNGRGRPLPAGEMATFQRQKRQLDTDLDRITLPDAPAAPAGASTGTHEEFFDEEEIDTPAPTKRSRR